MATKKKADSYTSYAMYGKKMQRGGNAKQDSLDLISMQKGQNIKAKPSKIGIKPKMKNGGKTSFGMLSVKAGIDKNPNPTAADRIAGAKMKSGKKMRGGGTVSMQLGSYGRQFGKNYSGKARGGMKVGKCKGGC